ncbi:MAG: 30S ribosomal protein S6, partial [Chloroflexota bacterium]|nr:30S ribosomal protein S6 [Chloroflexota bacterium]
MSSEFKRVRDYELMVIFHPELSEEDLTSEIGRVEGHITAAGGTITLINREAPWGRRRLAYA